ncbi:dinitrogenase iron-molybdenum cofactor biosynthesis protein [Desulfovibrio mangrovi]|uniref:NifB/NifX family molybdenum-iron cluster-binding protein n=1 Tax=Desulfovibrio mangrovi TaxID=2976983 RepID=UPI0022462933|nr:NifB/NifX family molybdenum-iron cluster-binding protein [Desulfovibrio mangrovi]UZP66070.1 dinitrogenase iron-molybdenum cofactor biosynthesis protein [Desulfovibrio mangrovi]
MKKILIALHGDEVSPRFDLTREAWIGSIHDGEIVRRRNVVLPQASSEGLCHLAVTEDVDALVCGGIEDEFYQYLHWKRITVYDNVIGPLEHVVQAYIDGTLKAGAVLIEGGPSCHGGNTGVNA